MPDHVRSKRQTQKAQHSPGAFQRIWDWSMQAEWRTWLLHALVCLPFAIAGGYLGAFAAFCVYFGREVGQWEREKQLGVPPNMRDHIMDLVGPFLICVVWGILFWKHTPVVTPEPPNPLINRLSL